MKKSFLILFLTLMLSPLYALNYTLHDNNSKTLNAIYAKGEVKANDTKRLDEFLDKLPNKKHTAIYLDSPGGNLYEGINLGMYFQRNRIKTVVQAEKMCASACAIAFLGGTDYSGNKWMSSTTNSHLGFHAFRNANGVKKIDSNSAQKTVGDILRYGKSVEAPMDIFIHNFSTPSEKMYWFSTQELLDLGIKVWDIDRDCFVGDNKCNKNKRVLKKYEKRISEVDFIRSYFNSLKSVPYKQTWNMLSTEMRKKVDFNGYVNWWKNKVDYVVLNKVNKINTNRVKAKLTYYMKSGKKVCSQDTFFLSRTDNKFYIDKQKYKNCF